MIGVEVAHVECRVQVLEHLGRLDQILERLVHVGHLIGKSGERVQ